MNPASSVQIKIAQYASGYSTGNDPKHISQVPSGHFAEWWSQGKADASEERTRLVPRVAHDKSIVAPVKAMYLETSKSTDEDLELCSKLREIVSEMDPKRSASDRYSDIMKAGEDLSKANQTTLTPADLAAIKSLFAEAIADVMAQAVERAAAVLDRAGAPKAAEALRTEQGDAS